MKFGYFDDEKREYVITTPQTPLPWINYLGNQDFFTLLLGNDEIKRQVLGIFTEEIYKSLLNELVLSRDRVQATALGPAPSLTALVLSVRVILGISLSCRMASAWPLL